MGPDFREQALKYKIDHLTGILLTHPHADHIVGLDDLRPYYFLWKEKIPCLLSRETFVEVERRFHYLFHPITEDKTLSAQIDFQLLEGDFGSVDFQGNLWQFLSYEQLGMKVTGYRLGKFAYVSDIREYTDRVFQSLEGVETLVLSALRHTPTKMPF